MKVIDKKYQQKNNFTTKLKIVILLFMKKTFIYNKERVKCKNSERFI